MCRPYGGGHLFNPPTHRHKRGCLRMPTVLRPKFSKKKSPISMMGPFFLPIPFQKKFSKKFFHIFSRRVIIFYVSILIFHFFYYRFIKTKISTTFIFRNAYIRILYKLLYSFIIYLFAFIFYYFCIRR